MQRAVPCHTLDLSCRQAQMGNTPIKSSHTTLSPDGSHSHENSGCDHDMGLPNSASVWTLNDSCGGRAATPTVGTTPCCRSPTGQPTEGPCASSQMGDLTVWS
eukprot:5385974-Amphidinium_carterae.10